MTDLTIDHLTAGTTPTGVEPLPSVQSGADVYLTVNQISSFTTTALKAATNTWSGVNTFSNQLAVALGATSIFTPISVTGSISNYFEIGNKNTSSNAAASTDVVCTADTGTPTTKYIDLGINSSGYTGGVFGAALEGYLYTSDDNLNIGAAAAGKSVRILAGGSSVGSNTVATFASTGLTVTALTLGSLNGLLKGVAGVVSAATAGTDYLSGSVAMNLAVNSAASTPAVLLSGAWYTAGNNTTNTPHLLVQPSAATAGNWHASGTGFGVNAPSGFAGALFDLQMNGTSQLRVNYNGTATFNGGITHTGTGYVTWYGTSPGSTTPGSNAVQFGGGILSVGQVLDSRGTLQVYSSATIGTSLSVGTTLAVNGITYTWPASNSVGVLTNNGTGTLTWSAAISALTGDVTASGTGAVAATISVGAVTDGKASLAIKPPCRVVAVANIASLSGTTTIDSVAVSSGDIVLLTAQSTGSQNGPWVVAGGAWARPDWYPNGGTSQAYYGVKFDVLEGTVYARSEWYITTSSAITIGTTSISLTLSSFGTWHPSAGTGTAGKVALWSSSSTLGDSAITQSGSDCTFAGQVIVVGTSYGGHSTGSVEIGGGEVICDSVKCYNTAYFYNNILTSDGRFTAFAGVSLSFVTNGTAALTVDTTQTCTFIKPVTYNDGTVSGYIGAVGSFFSVVASSAHDLNFYAQGTRRFNVHLNDPGTVSATQVSTGAGVLRIGGDTYLGAATYAKTRSVVSASGTTALDGTDHFAVLTGTLPQTFTLPAASSGRILRIKNRSSGTLTLNRAGSDTIDGGTSTTVAAGAAKTLIANGADWCVF